MLDQIDGCVRSHLRLLLPRFWLMFDQIYGLGCMQVNGLSVFAPQINLNANPFWGR